MAKHRKIWRKRVLTPGQRWRLKRFWERDRALKVILLITLIFLLSYLTVRLYLPEKVIMNETNVTIVEKEVVTQHVTLDRSTLKITAKDPTIVGRYGNNIQWYGKELRQIPGSADIDLDLDNDFGKITIWLDDASLHLEDGVRLNGSFRIEFLRFEGKERWMDEGIAENVDLYGDTGHLGDYLPRTHAYVGAWGRATLFYDDQVLYPDLQGEFLITEGLRREDGTIAREDGRVYQRQEMADHTYTDEDDREMHLFVYLPQEDQKNFPTKEMYLSVFFEDYTVESRPPGLDI